MLRKFLLVCGIVSSVLYVAMNVFVPMQYDGYSSMSQAVSELSAVGAPTRRLWVSLAIPYSVLFAAFGWGVWMTAGRNRRLRVVGGLILAQALIGLAWPPMHQREVLAAGAGTLTDTMHIVFSFVTLAFMLVSMGFGAAALGSWFRVYTVATIVIFLAFGTLTGLEGPRISANEPTPWIGVWERINIAAYMAWVMVLSIVLLRVRGHAGTFAKPARPAHAAA
jgi:hypothetical protein